MLIKYAETSQEKQNVVDYSRFFNQPFRTQTDSGNDEICKPSLPGYIDDIKCNRAAMSCIFILISNSIWCNCLFERLNYSIIIRYM